MSDLLLRAESLSKEYAAGVVVHAVRDVSLTVSRGEVVLIIGPNGSGKTTLLSMLGGLTRPTGGTIHLGDRALRELSDAELTDFRLRHVGFVFQSFRLLDVLSVRENVQLVIEMAGGENARDVADEMLSHVAALHLADRSPRVLSGGEKQRVAIARALANRPELILADEPTGSLDSAAGESAIALLTATARAEGRGVVIVSHDTRIAHYADRTIRMSDGQVQ
ncbi:MAG TPA: ABC transporter ATP-binding protein [Thermoanaerobaculia bacterium]|jgi:putative ABC transport system ATP-binding protein|nr:ABC transporter ATP-binding protein [Thermoanaerobaculia bacterium]